MFLLDHSGEAHFEQVVPNWEEVVKTSPDPPPGWGRGHFMGVKAVYAKARELGKYSDQWPQLIGYNADEPGRGEPMPEEHIKNVGKTTAAYNKIGMRCGTACIYPNVKNLVPVLDVIAWCTIVGGDLRGCKQAIEGAGKEFWVYHTGVPLMNPKLARWWAGYWTWQVQPKASLCWNWNGFITGDMADPKPKEVLVAYAKGVKDFKLLTAAENRLKRMPEKRLSWRV